MKMPHEQTFDDRVGALFMGLARELVPDEYSMSIEGVDFVIRLSIRGHKAEIRRSFNMLRMSAFPADDVSSEVAEIKRQIGDAIVRSGK